MIYYGQATKEDFPDILELQSENLISNLTPEERMNGFLTVEFTTQMLDEVIKEIPIVKAYTDNKLVGYRMAQTIEFNLRFPLLRFIIDRFPNIEFTGQKLSEYKTFISGPVCIDRDYRGKGVHEGMFSQMILLVKDQFDIGVTFIAKDNPRSLKAAIEKLKLTPVDNIHFNEKNYTILAFPTNKQTI